MLLRSRFFIILILIFTGCFASATVTDVANSAYTKMLCAFTDTKCATNKLPQALQMKIQACEMTNKSATCQKFIKDEPEFAFSLQNCTPQQFCKDQFWQEIDSLVACKNGFLIGTGENFTNMIDTVINTWKNLEQRGEEKIRFLKACDPSLACRQELAKSSPRYKDTPPNELMKLSVLALYTARSDYEQYGDVKLEGARTQLERLKKERAKGKQKPNSKDASIIKAGMDWLNKKMIRLECVDKKTQAELKCWGAAYILDPTLVAVSAAKVSTAAGRIFAKLSSQKVIESVAKKSLKKVVTNLDRRVTVPTGIAGDALVGKRIATLNILPNLPDSIALAKYKGADNVERVMMEKAVKTSSGEIRTVVREVQIDPLTGAVDANSPGGKALLENVLKESNGKSTLAFIDVNNLGYVNKNFTAGSSAGDKYLQDVGKAVEKATEGKAQFYKLGGDEYGLVINETDPKKVQAILDKVMQETYSQNVHSTFKAETVVQVKQFKDANKIKEMSKEEKAAFAKSQKENPAESTIKQFAPYSREGISVGSTRVGKGESLESVLERAEEQAKQMKIVTKEKMNISAKKYGGMESDPARKSDLRYVPKAEPPVAGVNKTFSNSSSPSLSKSRGLANETRSEELYRVGDVSVVGYTNEVGQKVTRYEKYVDDATPEHKHSFKLAPEVLMNEKTGLIDATKGSGEHVANLAVHAQGTEKSVVWINAEHLGKINYFEKGTAAGDDLLAATSEVIQKEVGKSGIPFKGQGSEFTVVTSGLSKQQVNDLNERIATALAADPEIKKVFADQNRALQKQLREAQGNPAKIAQIEEKIKDLRKIKPEFKIRMTSQVPKNEDISSVVKRLKEEK